MSREHIPFRIEGFPARVRPAGLAARVRRTRAPRSTVGSIAHVFAAEPRRHGRARSRVRKARGPAGRPARMRVGR